MCSELVFVFNQNQCSFSIRISVRFQSELVFVFNQNQCSFSVRIRTTDDQLHGQQEGRFYHGYYRHYCYLPLYITCGEHVLCARLRTAQAEAAEGTVAWSGDDFVDSGDCVIGRGVFD